MPLERVQKILAQVGVASRRKAEDLIREGEVTINGRVAQIGDKAEWGVDAIKVKGKLLHTQQAKVYYAFYKPRNVISMMEDPRERPCIADYTRKIKERLFPVGRLDFMSEGLILLTNDGEFVSEFAKREDIPRVYHVRVKGSPDSEMLLRIERGMRIDDKKIRPHSVRIKERLTQKAYIEVVMLGSGAQDIKVLFDSRGFLVDKMIRVSIGQVTLHGMNPGEVRQLKASQVKAILDQPELGMRMIENIQSRDKPRTAEELSTQQRPFASTTLPASGRLGSRVGSPAKTDARKRLVRPNSDTRSDSDRPRASAPATPVIKKPGVRGAARTTTRTAPRTTRAVRPAKPARLGSTSTRSATSRSKRPSKR